jgi:hypothetical protein
MLKYGLYNEFGESARNPGAYVERTAALVGAATRWVTLLGEQATASFVPLTDTAQPQLTAAPLLHIYSDAAQDADGTAGLCGFMHGYWWAVSIRGLKPGIIALLEFVALLVSVLVFGGLVHAPVCFHCDNTVVTAVINNATGSDEYSPGCALDASRHTGLATHRTLRERRVAALQLQRLRRRGQQGDARPPPCPLQGLEHPPSQHRATRRRRHHRLNPAAACTIISPVIQASLPTILQPA